MDGFWHGMQELLKGGFTNSLVSTGFLIAAILWAMGKIHDEIGFGYHKDEHWNMLLVEMAIGLPLFICALAWLWS